MLPRVAGANILFFSLNQKYFSGFPMSILVQPATFAVSRTVLSGGGMVAAGLNRPAKIILTLLDRFGNNLLLSDDESMSIARRVLLVCTSIEAVPFIQISGAFVSDISQLTVEYVVGLKVVTKFVMTFDSIAFRSFSVNTFDVVGTISPLSSFVIGSGIRNGIVGSEYVIQVYAQDSNNVLLKKGGDSVSVVVKSLYVSDTSSPFELFPQDSGNGIYKFRYTITVSGRYSVVVKINNQNSFSSPYIRTVDPGPVQSDSCFLSMPFVITAGVPATIGMQLRDSYFNNVPINSGTVLSAIVTSNVLSQEIVPKLIGSSFAVVATQSGHYSLQVFLSGSLFKGSSTSFVVVNNVADCRYFEVSGSGLSEGIASQWNLVNILALDVYGNSVPTSKEQLKIENAFPLDVLKPFSFSFKSFQISDAMFELHLKTTLSGVYFANLVFNGVIPCNSFPYSILVNPGVALTNLSTVTATFNSVRVTQSLPFIIRSRDQYGNQLTTGGIVASATVTPIGFDAPPAYLLFSDLRDGTYSCSFSTTQSGRYSVSVSKANIHYLGSPFNVTINPGNPFAPSSRLSTISVNQIVAGVLTTLVIETFDYFGNKVTKGGDLFEISYSDRDLVVRKWLTSL